MQWRFPQQCNPSAERAQLIAQKRYRVPATRTRTRPPWADGNRAISELAKMARMAKVESLRTSKRAQTRHPTRASQQGATDSNNLR